MDYETRQDSDGDLGNNQLVPEIAAAADAVGRTGGIPLIADAQGQIVLPEGATLDDLQVRGRDLVIELADGRVFVIPNGAVYVPEIVVGGVAVPPLNLAALLANPADSDDRPTPADIAVRSSGGNFSQAVRAIQDARDIGDLLPYTEFGFPAAREPEVIPDLVDRVPTTIIITPDNPSGAVSATASVNEAGLPGPRLNGNPESPGSNAAANSETTTGAIVFQAPDGLTSITLNGVAITAVNQTFTTPRGVLTITSIAPGNYGFSYTLTDNTDANLNPMDVFAVVVTDSDGDVASANLTINIVDDVPTARNDTDTVPAANFTGQIGNVVTGANTTSGAAGADTKGADDASVTGFRAGTSGAFAAPGTTINGAYGKLTFDAAGNYTYTRNAGTPGGVTDTFSYQLTDGDTDNSVATLVITITDSPAVVTSVPTTGGSTTVNESGLPTRPGETAGSNEPAPIESTSGTITFAAPDGVASVAINTILVTGAGQVITLPTGTFRIDSYNPAAGTLTYTFTLTDNTSGDTAAQVIMVTVTDIDGDSDTEPFTITIVDDTPTARDDAAAQATENAAVTFNVITGAGTTTGAAGADTPGADGVNLTTGVAVVPGSLSGAGTLGYNNDGSFTYTPAPGEQGTVTFQYRITDGDGDQSAATVTITLLRDSVPSISVAGDDTVDEAALPARPGEQAGSNAASSDETAVGTINIGTGGDTVGKLKIGLVDVTAGGVVAGAHGTLTVTLSAGVYSYSYTLTDNTLGDATTDPFTIEVTDSDGDVASTTLIIQIADDKPTAVNDTDSIAQGTYGPATGNVITDAELDGGKDTQGADGVTVTAISGFGGAGSVGGSTTGQYGTLTLGADGNYSYTRSPGTKGGVSDTFTYTITDGDGDTSSATLVIAIDDATPLGGSNAAVLLDDDALAGGIALGTGDDADAANLTGTLAGSGGDGPLTWAFATTGAPAGFSYVANGTGIDVMQGLTKVLAVTLNAATGGYQVTQVAPIVHATGSDENNQPFTLSYTVTDQDLDSVGGTLSIDVDDDTPTAANDTDAVTEDTATTATGNVLTGAGTDGNAAGADSIGADGPAVGGEVTAIAGGTVGTGFATAYGTLTLNADGSYTYALNNGLPAVQGLDGNDSLSESFTYTITDKDGDSTTAVLQITINGSDDPITITGLSAQGPDLLVDEDDLSDGSSPDAPALTQTGNFTVTGVDGITSVKVGGVETFVGQTFSTLHGTFTITSMSAAANGSSTSIVVGYSYQLTDSTAHPNANGQNSLTETFAVDVTDTDGSTASDQVEVLIVDDVPTAVDDADSIASGTYGPATGNVITDAELDGGKDTPGADGVTVTAISGFGGAGAVGGSTAGEYGTLTLNADGSYSYTRTAGTKGGVTDTFTYTITDADGDAATANLVITIDDARPQTAPNAAVLLDDDALTGGNALGTDDDADAANLTGTLAASGGDGPLTWAFATSGAPAGFSYVANGTGIDVMQGLTKVMTITLNAADGSYTVTQNAPIVHANGADENNQPFTLSYSVTDQDLDSANGTLSIDVDDDTPVAVNDSDAILSGSNAPATGNVITDAEADGGADSVGADGGAAVVAITGFGGAGAVGGITNGQWGKLTLNADGSYSYARNSGSPGNVQDVFTYTLTDADGDTTTATLTIDIEDARPVTGLNATVLLDDDALAGGNAFGTGDDTDAANLTGTLQGSGGDGALTWAFQTTGSPAGFSYVANGTGIDVFQGLTKVLTITLNAADGGYTVTQNAPIVHAAGADENNQPFTLDYTVTDIDLDSASGTLTIDVDDDTPTASNDFDTIAAGSYGPATGNVITDAEADGGADSVGADGGAAIVAITGFGGAGTIGGSTTGQYGTLTMNANGGYSYTRTAGTKGGVSDSFTYTLTDADGDTTTATLLITIDDATPLTGVNAQVLLDDDALAGGNAGGTDDDANAANLTGTLAGSGGDGPLTWAFATTGAPAGFSYVANGTGIDVMQGLTKVLTITLNAANGGYTVAQNAPIVHPNGADENNQPFTLSYTVTDQDLDTAGGTLVIDVDDDTPTAANDSDSLLAGATGPATGNVITDAEADGGADSVGADGGAAVVAITGFGGAGVIGGATVGQHGTLTMNANGGYSYVRSDTGAINTTDVFTYTLTDADGDTTTATLTITLQDAAPIGGLNATVLLDDDALAGGNALGTGDDADSANLTGTLAGSGGDGGLTWAFATIGAPLGFSYVANGTGIDVFQGLTKVLTVTLNAANGGYTVAQNAPIVHANGADENNQPFSLSYTVSDADGDSVGGTLAIDVDDDSPLAVNDTDTIATGTYGPATGNVITDAEADGGADSVGADGGAAIVAITGFGGAGTIGGSTTGQYGTLTMNADGGYSYTRTAGTKGGVSDSFTYTLTDADGDTTTATLLVTIDDALPLTGANGTVLLDDDALAGGNALGTGDDADAANLTGTLAGSGGDGPLTWALATTGAPVGFSYVANGTGIDVFQGLTKVLTITLNAADGSYTVAQNAPIVHANGADENNQPFSLSYTVTDQDLDVAGGTLSIDVDDDTPTAANDTDSLLAGATGPATGNVITDAEADGGADSVGADGGAAIVAITGFGGPGTVGGTTTGQHGTLTMNANGGYSYSRSGTGPLNATDTFTYTLTDADGDTTTATLTITIADAGPITAANLVVQLDDDALTGGNALGIGDDPDAVNTTGTLAGSGGNGALTWAYQTTGAPAGFSYVANGTGIDVFQGLTKVLTLTLNTANGAYTVTHDAPIVHASGSDENNQPFTVNYSVSDGDGDTAVGTLSIDVDDDTPIAIQPKATVMNNAIAAIGGNFLDNDDDVDNDYGADGAGKVVFTAATITALEGQGLSSGSIDLAYSISLDGTVLTATQGVGGALVFTIALQPPGSPDAYVIALSQKLDSLEDVEFTGSGFDIVGGNAGWAGFVPDGQGPSDTPVEDDSQDLLLTPMVGAASSSTVNTNATEAGVGGNFVDNGEGVRLDFVYDLKGAPVAGGAGNYGGAAANRAHNFDGHYEVNGASALFTAISTSSVVQIIAKDDFGLVTDGNDVVGDGVVDNITAVAITFNSVTKLVTVDGPINVGGQIFTVTFGLTDVQVSGVVSGTRLAGFTATNYTSIEFHNVGGDDFKIGSFGASKIVQDPVLFTVPVSIEDSDGDQIASASLAFTLNPTTPPVVLDLDGDGAEFLSTAAGVTYDYGSGLVGTAWVGPDDGLLAIDANGDGLVTGGEIVFGGNQASDLEGLAAQYDSNADGKLDAADAAFARFGVWQDADSDGVTDAGEFRSLSDLGISSISLVSDGQTATAAGGEVTVHGSTTYTRADGTTGIVADASFATAEARAAARSAELVNATVAGMALAAAVAPAVPAASNDTAATSAASAPATTEPETGQAAQIAPAELVAANDLFEAPDTGNQVAPRSAAGSGDTQSGPGAIADFGSDHGGAAAIADASEAQGFAASELFETAMPLTADQGMDALLIAAANEAANDSGQKSADLPEIREALADGEAENFVDHLIDQLAGGASSPTAAGTGSLHALLAAPVDGGSGMAGAVGFDHFDTAAHELAAAQG